MPVYAMLVALILLLSEISYSLKTGRPVDLDFFRPIVISQFVYMTVTLLLTRFVLWRYLPQKKYLNLLLSAIVVFTLFIFLRYFLEEILFPQMLHFRNYPKGTSLSFYTIDNFYYGLSYIVLGTIFFFIEYQFESQKRENSLIQQARAAELNFLRSQISPHFLFNSLNSIYSLSYKQSPKTPEAILQLSELVRFMLYEKKASISVASEWAYLQSYIRLQEMRYPYPLPLTTEVSGNLENAQIPPLLLIPLIENAFKRGNFKDPAIPLKIKLDVLDDQIRMDVSNKIGFHQKNEDGGIGLENSKRRLELLFPGSHLLEIDNENNIYRVQLTLFLK